MNEDKNTFKPADFSDAGNAAEERRTAACCSAETAGNFAEDHVCKAHKTLRCTAGHEIAGINKQRQRHKRGRDDAVDHLLRDYCKRVVSGAENECRGGDADGKEDRRTDHKKQNKSDYQSCHFAASFSAPRMIFISSAMLYIRKKTINAIVTVSAR